MFVRSFVEFALHRGPKVLTHRSGWPGLCVTRRPRLKGEHTRWCASQPSPQIALVTSELERPYLPKAPSHLWLGGLNLYLLTETPTPSARPGWSNTFIPGGPSLIPATRKGLPPLGPLRPKGRVKPLSQWTPVPGKTGTENFEPLSTETPTPFPCGQGGVCLYPGVF